MIDIKANPHRVPYKWGSIAYWKEHTACGVNDEWDRCEVAVPPASLPGFNIERAPYGEAQRDRIIRMLDIAFARGRADKVLEIRQVLEL